MKVLILAVSTLGLLALTQANVDYHLKCSRDEIGVRWPSYHSNSEYYVCQREGAKQLKVSCNPGELFTFVLQACTTPNKFIPPPPMDILPTANPLAGYPMTNGNGNYPQNHGQNQDLSSLLPKPGHPINNAAPAMNPDEPPILDNQRPPTFEVPPFHAPLNVENAAHHESVEGEHEESEEDGHLPGPPSPQASKPGKPGKPLPPLPPTPAPTPPLVQVTPPAKKQPPVPFGGKNKPPVPAGGSKKPAPPAPLKPSKKQPPTPPSGAKRQMPKLPSKV